MNLADLKPWRLQVLCCAVDMVVNVTNKVTCPAAVFAEGFAIFHS